MKLFRVFGVFDYAYGKKRKLGKVGINRKLSKSENTHC